MDRANSSKQRNRRWIAGGLAALTVPMVAGCSPIGIIATGTALATYQFIDIYTLPYRSIVGSIALSLVNSL